MKICMAQIEVLPGRPDKNASKIIECINQSKTNKTDMIVFPELCVPGYLIGDQWEEMSFVKDCESYNEDILKASKDITVLYGNIQQGIGTHKDGRCQLFNTIQTIVNNKFSPYYVKALLPNYREFEEPRHFTSSMELYDISYFTPVCISDVMVGKTLCEDGWSHPNSMDYSIKPVEEYIKRGAKLIINCSCSPYTFEKNKARNKVFGQEHAKNNKTPLIYVNATGLQNVGKSVYTFDGSSVAYNSLGESIFQAPMFEEGLYYVEYKDNDLYPISKSYHLPNGTAEVVSAMKYGAEKFLERCGTKRVVIGASGGIDSSVVASLFAQIVGPKNLLLINMPSKFNSNTTRNIARELAENIGCYYAVVPIEDSVTLTKSQIDGLKILMLNKGNKCSFRDLHCTGTSDCEFSEKTLQLSSLNLENVQARDRGSRILAAAASAWGGVFTNNGNKTEISVGYCTLMGDNGGFFAPLGDLWKHQVYEVGKYLNKTYPVIPQGAFDVVPSAELSSDQNIDEGKGDPLVYWYHDKLFESWQQWWFRVTPEENLKWYLEKNINEKLGTTQDIYKLFPTVKEFTKDLERWYKKFKGMSVIKRIQAPPILGLTRRVFGWDFRDYIGEAYFTREYLRMKKEALERLT